eukprot:SAG11_NODE_1075_length_5967_cov_7.848841_2_plen_125_part_00
MTERTAFCATHDLCRMRMVCVSTLLLWHLFGSLETPLLFKTVFSPKIEAGFNLYLLHIINYYFVSFIVHTIARISTSVAWCRVLLKNSSLSAFFSAPHQTISHNNTMPVSMSTDHHEHGQASRS